MKTSCAIREKTGEILLPGPADPTGKRAFFLSLSRGFAAGKGPVFSRDRTELVVLIYAFVTPIFLFRLSAGERKRRWAHPGWLSKSFSQEAEPPRSSAASRDRSSPRRRRG